MHGADYVSFGFGFGPPGGRCVRLSNYITLNIPLHTTHALRCVYLSDYTALLPPTEALLAEWCEEPGGIALMVLDALQPVNAHPVHATMEESVELARRLRPQRVLLVGMGHEMEHRESNRALRRLLCEEGLDVQLAYDGQFVPLSL